MSKNKNLKTINNGIIIWRIAPPKVPTNPIIIDLFAIGRNTNTTTMNIIISLQADIKLQFYLEYFHFLKVLKL